ncbi:MAG: four-carbon acid sugar kinase family protein, partial [Clostridia bacterium]|nr:four-carbon acid sugar kinase family protein [Clostridia bacterium]
LDQEDLRRGYDSGTCSRHINEGLAEITGRVMELVGREQVAGLLLTGGDTMESVCRRLQVSYIEAVDNIVPQVDVGRIMGKYTGLPVVVKGGFCGSKEIGKDIVRRIFLESAGYQDGTRRG